MTVFLILLITVLAIGIILFVSWFVTMKLCGKCPICAMKKIFIPTKTTIDVNEDKDINNNTALTPPMGWSSWNTFRQNINEDLILETANAMKNSGLNDAGYEFINLDDCWQSSMRDSMGRLQGDFSNFPNGIAEVIKNINELGLKVGLYSSNGTLTCEDLPASLYNEKIDAKTLASWGCEFFKYDFCHHKIISGNAPLIEAISISKKNTKELLKLTPEDCTYTGLGKTVKSNDIPSGEFIGYLSFGSGTASFNFDMEEEGKYILTFLTYKIKTRKDQYLQVIVNDKLYELNVSGTNASSPTGRQQMQVWLNEGSNTIILKNPVVNRADSSYIQYKRMGNALKEATKEWAELTNSEEKPITFSICEWGFAKPWLWGAKTGNLWRTTPDIMAKWSSILLIYSRNIKLWKYSKPGAWNDPDMLEVGNGKLTENENKAHFALWCMMASPLILGNDIREFVDNNNEPVDNNETLRIVTNKNLINIDQDSLGSAAKRIKKSITIDIIARPLANGDIAVCFLNKGKNKHSVTFDIDTLANDSYFNWNEPSFNYEIHELWNDERFDGKTISTYVPNHSASVYRIKRK